MLNDFDLNSSLSWDVQFYFSCSFDRCKGYCVVDCMIPYDWLSQGMNSAAKQGSNVELSKWQTGYRVIEEVYVLAYMWWAWGELRRGGEKNTSFEYIPVSYFSCALLPQCKKKYNLNHLVFNFFLYEE